MVRHPGGNLICIGTDEEFTGKVYFSDHEEEPEDPDDMSNVYLLANSFSDFLESCWTRFCRGLNSRICPFNQEEFNRKGQSLQ
ncbi:SMI1 / KNR4 family protein [compost metagenome]